MSTAATAAGERGLPLAAVELGGTKCVCILAHGPDAILGQVCGGEATELVDDILREVRRFTEDAQPADDRTLLGVVVS